MGRVMGFIALCVLVGVATGLVLDRVIVGMLVGAGLFLVGLFVLIGRAGRPGPET
jgi:hypothetical protein